jgi:hypothetical protein
MREVVMLDKFVGRVDNQKEMRKKEGAPDLSTQVFPPLILEGNILVLRHHETHILFAESGVFTLEQKE